MIVSHDFQFKMIPHLIPIYKPTAKTKQQMTPLMIRYFFSKFLKCSKTLSFCAMNWTHESSVFSTNDRERSMLNAYSLTTTFPSAAAATFSWILAFSICFFVASFNLTCHAKWMPKHTFKDQERLIVSNSSTWLCVSWTQTQFIFFFLYLPLEIFHLFQIHELLLELRFLVCVHLILL